MLEISKLTAADWQTVAEVAGPLLTAGGLLAGWLKWRDTSLRRDDVRAWAVDTIKELQSLFLVCLLDAREVGAGMLEAEAADAKLTDIAFNTAILVERGRLFFRNRPAGAHGAHKQPAYRGRRPAILDPIVLAHQIAVAWRAADPDTKLRYRCVAEDALKTFVSLAQKEVGRSRAASAYAGRSGNGVKLARLAEQVDARRLEKLLHDVN